MQKKTFERDILIINHLMELMVQFLPQIHNLSCNSIIQTISDENLQQLLKKSKNESQKEAPSELAINEKL